MANNNLTRNILEGTITQEEANQLRAGEAYSDSTRGMSDLSRAMYDEKKAEESTMTNPVKQLMSFIQRLFKEAQPKAHDVMDRIIDENNQIDTLKLLQNEYNLPGGGNIDLDSLLQAGTPQWLKGRNYVPPPGPNVMSSPFFKKSYNESNVGSLIEALMRSQGEFGAAQPVQPRLMPR